jgi:bifunctional non-homologous end joining protein LigD
MAARIERGDVQLLTRSGLDWTETYVETAAALAKLPVSSAHIDGELCGVGADGVTLFAVEATYLTWTDDEPRRHTVFFGLREDKPAKDVRREPPTGKAE